MRKNKDFKTYGRHRNRVISSDVWMSDNDKRRNVFSTSSELDSSKQSSLFQNSSIGSEKSGDTLGSSLFESSKTGNRFYRQKVKPSEDKENIPTSRKKNRLTKTNHQSIFSSGSSTDVSLETDKKVRRRALRDRNNKIDYNDSANLKKQLRGTTAKRKRAVKVNNDKDAVESVNFSEFDEYSLVISDSPVVKNDKSSRQEMIETSTPVAKRTRGQESTFDKIRNSDLSHIEVVTSPFPDGSYSVCTPASSLRNVLSVSSISTPSVISSLLSSDQYSDNISTNDCRGISKSSPEIGTPENAVVHLEKLRESFILKHVSGRRKTFKTSKKDNQLKTPEDVFVRIQRLRDSFIDAHSAGRKTHSSKLNMELENNNSLSLFESPYVPYILTRNRAADNSDTHKTKENLSIDSCEAVEEDESEDEFIDDDEEEEEVDEEEGESDNVEVGNLSAIAEHEEDYDNSYGEDNDSDRENIDLAELENSMKDLQLSHKNSRPSEETLYMLNPDYNGEENSSNKNSENTESEQSCEMSGSRDLFSTYGGVSKMSLRSAKNYSCKSDYFTASSAHVSEEEDFVTADDEEEEGESDNEEEEEDDDEEEEEDNDGEEEEDNNEEEEEDDEDDSNGQKASHANITDQDCSIPGRIITTRRSCHLRDKHLLSLQDSFKELLTPTKKKNSLVPLSARTKLLVLCDQSEPVTFQEAIPQQMLSQCKKIGEGVYGEVFQTCDVALKIIPIEGDFTVNDEPQKKFEEILPEVVIAKELSSLRYCKTSMTTNFCEVRSVSLVKGKYPAKLLKEWDLYHRKKGSENDRPDMFTDTQLFILFEFADCGKDLESFEFENMYQARSVLTQVVYSLAVAEESLQFEHRDLHWGNVLVKPTDQEDITYKLMGKRCSVPSMGVEANIIDFTLSRLTKDKCSVYTDLSEDDSLFEGKGDYQFDIYRKMKEENSNNWETFNPHSNVLWLHYLADKLVYAKKYPSQASRQDRDIIRQFRQFLSTMLGYQSACEMAKGALFLNS